MCLKKQIYRRATKVGHGLSVPLVQCSCVLAATSGLLTVESLLRALVWQYLLRWELASDTSGLRSRIFRTRGSRFLLGAPAVQEDWGSSILCLFDRGRPAAVGCAPAGMHPAEYIKGWISGCLPVQFPAACSNLLYVCNMWNVQTSNDMDIVGP